MTVPDYNWLILNQSNQSLCCTVLHLHRTAQCSDFALHFFYTWMHCTKIYCIALKYIASHNFILNWIAKYITVLQKTGPLCSRPKGDIETFICNAGQNGIFCTATRKHHTALHGSPFQVLYSYQYNTCTRNGNTGHSQLLKRIILKFKSSSIALLTMCIS